MWHRLGHHRGSGGVGHVELLVIEEHLLQALAHVPFDVVGQHAQEGVGTHVLFGVDEHWAHVT